MNSPEERWLDDLLASTPAERLAHFREHRVTSSTELSPETRRWLKQVLDEHQEVLQELPSPPLRVHDHRESNVV
jgi:hypothetical protein